MMWVAISHDSRKELVHEQCSLVAPRYRDDIIRLYAIPIIQNDNTIHQNVICGRDIQFIHNEHTDYLFSWRMTERTVDFAENNYVPVFKYIFMFVITVAGIVSVTV